MSEREPHATQRSSSFLVGLGADVQGALTPAERDRIVLFMVLRALKRLESGNGEGGSSMLTRPPRPIRRRTRALRRPWRGRHAR